jgi:hypothetical protein
MSINGSKVWVRDIGGSPEPSNGHYRSRTFLIELSATSQANLLALQNAILTCDSRHATGYNPSATFTLTSTIAAQNDDFEMDTDEATTANIVNTNDGNFGNAGAGAYFAYYCRFNLQLLRGISITSATITFSMVAAENMTFVADDIAAIPSNDIMNQNGVADIWPDLTLGTSALQMASWRGTEVTQPSYLTGSEWNNPGNKIWVEDETEDFDVTDSLQALQDSANYIRGIGLVFGRTTNAGQASFHMGTHADKPTISITYTYTTAWPYYLEMKAIGYDDDPNIFHEFLECTARWAI